MQYDKLLKGIIKTQLPDILNIPHYRGVFKKQRGTDNDDLTDPNRQESMEGGSYELPFFHKLGEERRLFLAYVASQYRKSK